MSSWEKMHGSRVERTRRMKVPGGWIYLHEHTEDPTSPESMVFVPDPVTESDKKEEPCNDTP